MWVCCVCIYLNTDNVGKVVRRLDVDSKLKVNQWSVHSSLTTITIQSFFSITEHEKEGGKEGGRGSGMEGGRERV